MTAKPPHNPRTTDEALHAAYVLALHNGHVTPGQCDHIVAVLYGYEHSGEVDAVAHWRSNHAYQHAAGHHTDPFRGAPPGSLGFWAKLRAGKPTGHGHVALIARHDGFTYTPDLDAQGNAPGEFNLLHQHIVQATWGMTPLGWTPPVFLHGTT